MIFTASHNSARGQFFGHDAKLLERGDVACEKMLSVQKGAKNFQVKDHHAPPAWYPSTVSPRLEVPVARSKSRTTADATSAELDVRKLNGSGTVSCTGTPTETLRGVHAGSGGRLQLAPSLSLTPKAISTSVYLAKRMEWSSMR